MTGKAPAASATRSVERALALLASVCDGDATTLAECARVTDLPASTALRLLRTLEKRDFVSRDDAGEYRAGPRMMQLGAQALAQERLVQVCRPALLSVVGATGESAYLSVLGPGTTALYVAMIEGTHSIRHTSWVGRTGPLEGSAVGAALLGQVSEAGFAVRRSTLEPDVIAVAAPLRTPSGVAGALSIVGPDYRMDPPTADSYGRLLVTETAGIARTLGVDPRALEA